MAAESGRRECNTEFNRSLGTEEKEQHIVIYRNKSAHTHTELGIYGLRQSAAALRIPRIFFRLHLSPLP